MDDFGRGGRWICECGSFYDTLEGCIKCKNTRMRSIMARKTALNRLNGLPNKTAQKRAKKAVATKIVNLFKLGNVEKGQKMLNNLKKKSPSRWGHVNRLIKKIGR